MLRASLLLVVVVAAAAEAAPVAVANPSFEQDPAANGTFPALIPAGWSLVDPGDIVDQNDDAVGVVNSNGAPFFPAGVPDGDNAALIFLRGDVGQGEVSLTQVIAAALQAETAYTLTVDVGNIASGTGLPPFDVFGFFDLDGFPGYRVALLAGGIPIASDENTLGASLAEGTFGTSVVLVEIPASHPALGQPLEIRLTNLNVPGTAEEPGIEVDFDDVRLDATPVPAAAGPLELAAGVLALGALRAARAATIGIASLRPR